MTRWMVVLAATVGFGACSPGGPGDARAEEQESLLPALEATHVGKAMAGAATARRWFHGDRGRDLRQSVTAAGTPTLSAARKPPVEADRLPAFARFPAFARQIYVGPDGSDIGGGDSADRPLRTIQAALREARALGPGTEIVVRAGTYDEGTLAIDYSGDANGWVALRGYPGERPVIVGTPWQLLHVRGSYVLIEGLELDGDRVGRTMEDGTKLETAADLYRWASMHRSCLPTGENCGSGVYVEGWSSRPVHHVIVRDVVAHDFPGGGIQTNAADFLLIEDNLTFGNGHYSYFGHSGISVFQPNPVGSREAAPYRIVIRRNASFSNHQFSPSIAIGQNYTTDGNGIIIDMSTHYKYAYRILVANNIVFDNGGSGIHAYHSANVDIVNNTSYLNSTNPRLKGGEIFPVDARNIRIFNNILYGGGEGNSLNVLARSRDIEVGGNILFGEGKAEIVGKTDTKVDPGLVAPSIDPARADFSLRPDSAARGRADKKLVVDGDFFGRPRGAAADVGAIQSR